MRRKPTPKWLLYTNNGVCSHAFFSKAFGNPLETLWKPQETPTETLEKAFQTLPGTAL